MTTFTQDDKLPYLKGIPLNTLTITQPDDWHLHVRDGKALSTVIPHTAERFARAIIMPNLAPPVTTTDMALAYRERILQAVPTGNTFNPLMTIYLTDNTSPEEIRKAKQSGKIHAVKLYPSGATTNSDAGVTDIRKTFATLAIMEELDIPLLVHGESTRVDIDVFDREKIFIDETLLPLNKQFPKLRIVFEHITTADAVELVFSASANIAATITAHHLLLNRNAMFAGGIHPHYYCLPILKREKHRTALLEAATSGHKHFFLGTDSAPHTQDKKESSCGCAGIYTAHAAIELYAEAFEQAGKLEQLESFASFNGPDFYQLPRNSNKITLIKETWKAPDSYPLNDDKLIPFRAGENIIWKIQ